MIEPALSASEDIWLSCLSQLREQVNPLTFRTWFEPLKAVRYEDGLLTIEVPSTYFYEWIEEHFSALIQSALQDVVGSQARLQYAVKVQKQEQISRPLPVMPPSITATASAPVPVLSPNLNQKFTFDNFIKGDGNQFARAAALNVASNPGETAFNPLVLYGGVGLGKTHLIQAIGNAILASAPDKRVCYVSSEKFTVDFVDAIEKNRAPEFSAYYRSMDVLIVDDIQFFAGKERTQDTFFHTFNTLYQLKKQIVLSSDRPPRELQGLDERLISRFQCGLTVDIQPPDLETRIAILRKKADADRIDIPQDVIEVIATNVKSNIRELEGCYIGLIARHTLEKRPIDIPLAETVIRNVVSSEKKELSVEQIQKIVADHFKVTENSLRAKTRKQEIVLPRQVAMYLAKNLTNASLKTIGLHFGGRDHTTIIHACRTISDNMENDDTLRNRVREIERQLSYLSR